ncbi:MAG: hypothetical protein ACK5QX_03840, partial [bacterium]
NRASEHLSQDDRKACVEPYLIQMPYRVPPPITEQIKSQTYFKDQRPQVIVEKPREPANANTVA